MHVVRTWESETNVGTLQDVHPDQLCSLWTTANLVLEKILRLKGKMSTGRSVKHFLLHDQFFSPALSNTTVQECIFSASEVYTYRTLFSNWVPHPGPLQTANLPVESCRALESCNTQHTNGTARFIISAIKDRVFHIAAFTRLAFCLMKDYWQ